MIQWCHQHREQRVIQWWRRRRRRRQWCFQHEHEPARRHVRPHVFQELDEALPDIDKALALDPSHAEAWFESGNILLSTAEPHRW